MIDYEKLREDLVEYYGSAMSSGISMATIETIEAEYATEEELTKLAKKAGIDINKYNK